MKPKSSEVTLIQRHKGYEEEVSRSYRWLGSIKSFNKRIKEFPSSVNFKNDRRCKNSDNSRETFDLQGF